MEKTDPHEADVEVEALHGERESADDPTDDGTRPEPKPELDDFSDFKVTAPIFPWELVIRQSQSYFQRTPSGGMQLKFCAVVRPGPAAPPMPIPPGFVIEFSAAGWERFKKAAALDGDVPPEIQTATVLPPGVGR